MIQTNARSDVNIKIMQVYNEICKKIAGPCQTLRNNSQYLNSNKAGLCAHHLWLDDLFSCCKIDSLSTSFSHKNSDELFSSLFDQEILPVLFKSLAKAFSTTINQAEFSLNIITEIMQLFTWMASYSSETCESTFFIV